MCPPERRPRLEVSFTCRGKGSGCWFLVALQVRAFGPRLATTCSGSDGRSNRYSLLTNSPLRYHCCPWPTVMPAPLSQTLRWPANIAMVFWPHMDGKHPGRWEAAERKFTHLHSTLQLSLGVCFTSVSCPFSTFSPPPCAPVLPSARHVCQVVSFARKFCPAVARG